MHVGYRQRNINPKRSKGEIGCELGKTSGPHNNIKKSHPAKSSSSGGLRHHEATTWSEG